MKRNRQQDHRREIRPSQKRHKEHTVIYRRFQKNKREISEIKSRQSPQRHQRTTKSKANTTTAIFCSQKISKFLLCLQ